MIFNIIYNNHVKIIILVLIYMSIIKNQIKNKIKKITEIFSKKDYKNDCHKFVKPENKTLHILILGGGPVGLFAGYKLLKRGNKITIFEKRKQYTRHNIVGLTESRDMDILSVIPSEIMEELIKTSCYGGSDKSNKNKKCYKDFYKNAPYEQIQARTIYVILNEFEMAVEKHFKLCGGTIIKPNNDDAFEDIVLEGNMLNYKEKDQGKTIDMSEYDIIFLNDGANSYYRSILFDKTSFVDNIQDNIFYYGLDDQSITLKAANNRNNVKPFAYGLLMIHEIKNKAKFDKLFRADAKLYSNQQSENLLNIKEKTCSFCEGFNLKEFIIEKEYLNGKNGKDEISNKNILNQNLFRMFISEKFIYISNRFSDC